MQVAGEANLSYKASEWGTDLMEEMETGFHKRCRTSLKRRAMDLPSLTLTLSQLCDIELLLNGGFFPLAGFMDQKAYKSVLYKMRLPNGQLWPIPVVIDLSQQEADKIKVGEEVALRDPEGLLLAILTVNSIWVPDKEEEAHCVFGTTDPRNPGVSQLYHRGKVYLGGELAEIKRPKHYDFQELRQSPETLKNLFKNNRNETVLGFQTENLIHKRDFELTMAAVEATKGHLLIQSVVGTSHLKGLDDFFRIRCLKRAMPYYPLGSATLNILPFATRLAGSREALLSALINKSYGCTHFVLENPRELEWIKPYSKEIGIETLPLEGACRSGEFLQHVQPATLSAAEIIHRLDNGVEIPKQFSFPEVISELQKAHPPRNKQGFTVFFTGLSGSGKSTIANGLTMKLMAEDQRRVTLLDGDVLRTFLSSELGFSKEHRSLNVRRIGFVAGEITKNGGVAICCPIAPYQADRGANRERISQFGAYIEVFVSTPIEECERRDRKGLYAKARKGLLKQFTGIDDPYEPPVNPELVLDTTVLSVAQSIDKVIGYLKAQGYLSKE